MTTPKITPAIDAYIESVTEDREPDGMYHPSSMFLCIRQAIYDARGTERTSKPDKAAKRRFYIGHRLHEAVQRAVESMPGVVAVYPEFSVDYKDKRIKGHGDILIVMNDGTAWIIEIKSIKKFGMKAGLPKEQHVKQAKTYAVAVAKSGFSTEDDLGISYYPARPIAGVVMVYVEKEDLDVKEFVLTWKDAWVGEVAETVAELEVYRNDPASLPARLPRTATGKKPWPCNYCDWAKKCYSDPDEIVPTILEGVEIW